MSKPTIPISCTHCGWHAEVSSPANAKRVWEEHACDNPTLATKLCACGCGEEVGADATWKNQGHYASPAGVKARRRAAASGKPLSRHDLVLVDTLAAPMHGSCMFCETTFDGTAHEVLAAQAKHRDRCANRPASLGKPRTEAMREAVRLRASGMSYGAVADELNRLDLLSPTGLRWNERLLYGSMKQKGLVHKRAVAVAA